MHNPLLEIAGFPPFSQVEPEHVEPAIDAVLKVSQKEIERLLDQAQFSWADLIAPMDAIADRLHQTWSPAEHMNAVVNSDALRSAYNACLPKLSAFATELGQNTDLHAAVNAIADSADREAYDAAQIQVLTHQLRDFHLAGVDLPEQEKTRFKALMQELSTLQSKFQDNVLDATQAWTRHVTDEGELAGLPDSALGVLRQNAERKGLDGWLITLDIPSYLPVMTHADNRALREETYAAFITRASDQGPQANRFDNSEVMDRILALRHEAAALTGFNNFAERSVATKMAADPEEVMAFLSDLARRARPQAQTEFRALCQYANETFGVETLAAWDVPYYSEKLRRHRYDISQEELRPYFPEPKVVPGMFAVAQALFGITLRERSDIDTWHEDVRFFDVLDADGNTSAHLYLDLYARANKRGGAWMNYFRGRRRVGEHSQTPVAFITCNFTPPVGDQPALFTHDEVTTLFHEFGHALHHMLTRIDYGPVAGINGVEWDAVELPSQLLENWCWEREALDLIAAHHETGETIPEDLYQRMQSARNFQSAMMMVRQLEFALFDFRLHAEYRASEPTNIVKLWQKVRSEVAVVPVPDFARFPHAFSHIFAGGYAAGYYSYKWAEVLSADVFSAFREEGIFDRAIGERFLHSILEVGGSRDAMDNFVEFRGRKPIVEPLLELSGISVAPNA